jgi:hypothetical protein
MRIVANTGVVVSRRSLHIAQTVSLVVNSSGVYICKSEVNYLRHGNYICKSEVIYLVVIDLEAAELIDLLNPVLEPLDPSRWLPVIRRDETFIQHIDSTVEKESIS